MNEDGEGREARGEDEGNGEVLGGSESKETAWRRSGEGGRARSEVMTDEHASCLGLRLYK